MSEHSNPIGFGAGVSKALRIEFEKFCEGFSTALPTAKDPQGDYLSVLTGNFWLGWQMAYKLGARRAYLVLRRALEETYTEKP